MKEARDRLCANGRASCVEQVRQRPSKDKILAGLASRMDVCVCVHDLPFEYRWMIKVIKHGFEHDAFGNIIVGANTKDFFFIDHAYIALIRMRRNL